jgi:hypothetical protein
MSGGIFFRPVVLQGHSIFAMGAGPKNKDMKKMHAPQPFYWVYFTMPHAILPAGGVYRKTDDSLPGGKAGRIP